MRGAVGAAPALAALLLASCAGEPAASTEDRRFVYSCPDGTVIVARFPPERAEVVVDGRAYTLPQAISASGARYAAGDVTFWIKGREALFEQESGPAHRGCVTDWP